MCIIWSNNLYNTVLKLKPLPLYKFSRPHIQFNLIKFLNKYLLFFQQPYYLFDEERSLVALTYRFTMSLLQSSNTSHFTHSNYLYTISWMFRLGNRPIQQLSISALWFCNMKPRISCNCHNHYVERISPVQSSVKFRHTNACMTSMRWLIGRIAQFLTSLP